MRATVLGTGSLGCLGPPRSLRDRSPAALRASSLRSRIASILGDDAGVSAELVVKGALPPRLATRPLPRRLRRARCARVVPHRFDPRGRRRRQCGTSSEGGLAPAARYATAPP